MSFLIGMAFKIKYDHDGNDMRTGFFLSLPSNSLSGPCTFSETQKSHDK